MWSIVRSCIKSRYILLTLITVLLSASALKADGFDDIREKWNRLICPEADVNIPEFQLKVRNISNTARNWRSKLNNDSSGRTWLWSDLNYSRSAHITESYRRLAAMAIAYKTMGTAFYRNEALKNEIVSALDWLCIHHYNERTKLPDGSVPTAIKNWWDYKIGVPLALNNITSLLYEELTKTQRDHYMSAVDHCDPDLKDRYLSKTPGVYTAANRVWICTVIAVRAILIKDSVRLIYARNELSPVFGYVTTGDGFYKDGSFIQHDKTPYNGGYGTALIDNLSSIMYLLADTRWEIKDPGKRHVFDWVFNSFTPFFTQSGLMPMTTGREISRPRNDADRGRTRLMNPVLLLSEIAPVIEASRMKSILKGWLLKDTAHYQRYLNIFYLVIANKIVHDPSILPLENYLFKPFPNMDQVVLHKPRYAFSISMYSDRIFNYEEGNGENRKGWHTGDGMTYLYNGDFKQFEGTFWPTVNSYKLPGTTVEENTELARRRVSETDWVGAVSLKNVYGTAGMDLAPPGQTLKGRKSWFMFDNEIVALGAGILNKDETPVHTYIEQRKLANKNTNDLTINGTRMRSAYGSGAKPEIFPAARWAYLSGTAPGSDIGYYFPDADTLTITRKKQTGYWKDINTYRVTDTSLNSNYYLTLWKDHGIHTGDNNTVYNRYSYVLLPDFTKAQVRAYSLNPDIRILANNSCVQAVNEATLHIVGANFWKDSLVAVCKVLNKPYLTCDKKASVMVRESADSLDISLSDPTMKNTGTITITVNSRATKVIASDAEIKIEQLAPQVKIIAGVKDLKGKTVTVTLLK